ncbi:class I SAM-dependent methyltransferase [Paracoccus methylarcula]|uniref:Class I SAM-dependent methyltransferase n=1 Tax=Paracoccus methylarcula TaxID=72022 RepID=A0A3R7M8G3_9RHOB|nr:class I SAM-dependent methyltransferase [Paracoccus methylarcula]RNF33918.1 class I SAM-dependent methyltransferase [Paracoccus methylarcula]
MTTATKVFDPIAFKQTTRRQWDEAAEAWNRWAPLLDRWLGPSTELMLDRMGLAQGSRVLDIAAGAGGQTLNAARRVGPSGHVLATDLSPGILQHAKANADLAGLGNVETLVLDGEQAGDIKAEPFDGVMSRVGLIYFPDQHKALTGMHAQLRPGGHIGAITYAEADRNGFFSVPVGIIRRRAALPAPLPGQPGPFSLGDPDLLASRLRDAGFTDIDITRVAAPVRLNSARECLQFERESFGALHQMLAGLTAPEQDDIWGEIEEALRAFETGGRFEGPCEMLVATGTKAA